jgi:NTP pyrophosphatase (non-canonical NTP hydrolase)
MRISDIQRDAFELCEKHKWADRNPSQRFRYLISEVGELSRELLRLEWNGEDPDAVKRSIAHEMYDVIWNVCDLANQLGIDLERYFEEKKNLNLKRTWSNEQEGDR